MSFLGSLTVVKITIFNDTHDTYSLGTRLLNCDKLKSLVAKGLLGTIKLFKEHMTVFLFQKLYNIACCYVTIMHFVLSDLF